MAYNTIKLKKYVDIIVEKEAYETITPGMLIELTSANKVKKHATSGGNVVPIMFAIEDELQGKDIDDNYVAGDKVQCMIARPGDEVYAVLSDGETVSIGDALDSNGDGCLQKHTVETWTSADAQEANTVYSKPIVAIALERKDLSGSSGEGSAGESSVSPLGYNKRIKVMVV